MIDALSTVLYGVKSPPCTPFHFIWWHSKSLPVLFQFFIGVSVHAVRTVKVFCSRGMFSTRIRYHRLRMVKEREKQQVRSSIHIIDSSKHGFADKRKNVTFNW
jgi:hypothetical protein